MGKVMNPGSLPLSVLVLIVAMETMINSGVWALDLYERLTCSYFLRSNSSTFFHRSYFF